MAEDTLPTIVLTFKYRLRPTRAQYDAFDRILEDQRQLYNAALQERIDCYRKTGKSISYIDQTRSLTIIRRECEGWSNSPSTLQRGTLKRLDEAFQGFFRRVKRGEKPGFPRFKSKDRFRSFDFAEFVGINFDGKRFRLKGVQEGLRVYLHRPLPEGKILTAKFGRDVKGWHVCLAVRVACDNARDGGREVGIDVGITSLAALSTGEMIENVRPSRKVHAEMRRRQRALARCKRGSNRRQKVRKELARLHGKITNTRSTHLHQVSARLVRDFDLIAVEKLNVKGLAGGMLARDVHDASWGKLRAYLSYKAEKAGVEFIEVDPKYTSQTCPDCGAVEKKQLSERVHSCPCGCVLDRDVAAAKVILQRAVARPQLHNAA